MTMLRVTVLWRSSGSRVRNRIRRSLPVPLARMVTTASQPKRAGDISDAFASLSGLEFKPLEPRYAELKKRLIEGHEDAVRASWKRLLEELRTEIPLIAQLGSKVIPEVQYKDIVAGTVSQDFVDQLRKRGVAVVRGVVDEQEALDYKRDIKEYVKQNPHTKAFPAENPQVFELYWSKPQMRARTHPNLLNAQRFLMSMWHSRDDQAPLSTLHPVAYADRLRIRLPGDAKFALGPHVDGGSVERWEPAGYGDVYASVFRGSWESYEPWESSGRLGVVSDMHAGVGACSAFRMFQGWLAMSATGPREGTLLVCPLLRAATAYFLLRPFFGADDELENEMSAWLHGAAPGRGQELAHALHPHLDLPRSMVHLPAVRPGDYVAWHCDTIHAVDAVHTGTGDSSVLYIPACPLTEGNARYLVRQRDCFTRGVPSPDFGGGEGESKHIGRPTAEDVSAISGPEGLRALGLKAWDNTAEGLTPGQKNVLESANGILGFNV